MLLAPSSGIDAQGWRCLCSEGALQVCAGQQAGCEVAVHAVRMIYEDPSNEAVLLVDATNAFNTLNRNVALVNVNKKCPPLAKVLINTYRHNP